MKCGIKITDDAHKSDDIEPFISTFELFNFWGERIFASTNPLDGWMGQVEDEPAASGHSGYFAPDGLYVWRLRVSFDEGELFDPPLQEYNGTVLIIR